MSTRVPDTGSDLRARILEAAGELFGARGYGSVSIREVCETVGCTKPALYYWFDSKAALFSEAADTALALFSATYDARLGAGAADHMGVRPWLEAYADSYIQLCTKQPWAIRLLLTAGHSYERGQPTVDLDQMFIQQTQNLVARVAQGITDGEISPQVDPQEAALAVLGAVHVRAMAALAGAPTSPDAPRRVIDLFFRGLAP